MASQDPYPSIADLFWLVGYVPLIIGLIMAIRETEVSLRSSRTPMLCLVIGIMLALATVFLIQPILASTKISVLEKFLDLAYPLFDLALIIPTLTILILYERGLLGKPWLFILTGFVCFGFADLLFSYFTWQGVFEQFPYNLIDLIWDAGYLAIGLGILYKQIIVEIAMTKSEPRFSIKKKITRHRVKLGV